MDTDMPIAGRDDGEGKGRRTTGPAPATDALHVVHQLRRALQRVQAQLSDCIGDAEVTPAQMLVLGTLDRHGPLTQAALGRMVHMDPATTHGIIVRLLARSLVSRTGKVGDRRCVVVQITPEGAEFHRACRSRVRAEERSLLAPLGEQEAATLLGLLERLM